MKYQSKSNQILSRFLAIKIKSMEFNKKSENLKKLNVESNHNNESKVIMNNHNTNQLFKVFEIIKYMIWDFFIGCEGYSNLSLDSMRLIIVRKTIRKILIGPYITRALFHLNTIQRIDLKHRLMIRHICIEKEIEQLQLFENIRESVFSLKTLIFADYFNHVLEPGILPDGLMSLKFGWCFDKELKPGSLPDSLVSLEFGRVFNQVLEPGVLPDKLEKLSFSSNFNQKIKHSSLPKSLRTLIFGTDFNQVLEPGVFPDSLASLEFGCKFNKELISGVLPNNLKLLKFGRCFNQPIRIGSLPSSLTVLVFGKEFDQPLKIGSLPMNLIDLNMCGFNHLLNHGVLPMTLKKLALSGFNQPLKPNILPPKLEQIIINPTYSHSLVGVLPHGLISVEFSYNRIIIKSNKEKHFRLIPGIFPDSVQILRLPNCKFDQNLSIQIDGKNVLPSHLTELTITKDYCKNSGLVKGKRFLPLGLRKLTIRYFVSLPRDEQDEQSDNMLATQLKEFLGTWNYVIEGTDCIFTLDKHKNKQLNP